jgi:hypothetical protein
MVSGETPQATLGDDDQAIIDAFVERYQAQGAIKGRKP